MVEKYNQFRAMFAVTKASLQAMVKSPSSVMFSIGFPLVFILIFGFMGSGSKLSMDIAFSNHADTTNPIFIGIKNSPGLIIKQENDSILREDLQKGRVAAIVDIQQKNAQTPYHIQLTSSHAVPKENLQVLQTLLHAEVEKINTQMYPKAQTIATVDNDINIVPGRTYRNIDFILPGMLGFSLLAAGIFGVAFLFFNLRQQLVLKRFFSTPIKRTYIILGEALSRVIFQLITAIIIIIMGVVCFKFTLIHGAWTFIEILILSFYALIIFMGCGFIVSSISKTESAIPPLANIFTMPQFLLAGTFFPVDTFPKWLQGFCNLLPLTHFNNAMRNISFEGLSLLQCWPDILNLTIWGIIVYAIAVKTFKWE